MTEKRRVMFVYGTRPEAIKLAPIIRAMERSPAFAPTVVVTAQHRSMLDEANAFFGVRPDHDLAIMAEGQTLTDLTVRALRGLEPLLARNRPDVIVVQGDTTSTFVGALAASYHQVPVAHVEAGLRTYDRASPFPEEINRQLTTRLADLHLAPTDTCRQQLLDEGIDPEAIAVTGNSVIDALLWAVGQRAPYGDPALSWLDDDPRRVLLVTAHRRESWGVAMEGVGRALARIAEREPGLVIVLPVHRNPKVRAALLPELQARTNVVVTEPLAYGGFCRLIERADVVLTDSGGLQEEAPSLGKPVLVMRNTTERGEAIAAGTARLVGTDEHQIADWVHTLLHDRREYQRMANAINPYGDGHAAERTLDAIGRFFARARLRTSGSSSGARTPVPV